MHNVKIDLHNLAQACTDLHRLSQACTDLHKLAQAYKTLPKLAHVVCASLGVYFNIIPLYGFFSMRICGLSLLVAQNDQANACRRQIRVQILKS